MPGLTTYTEPFEDYNGASYATGTFALTTGSWYVVAAFKDSATHGGSVSVRLNDDVAGSCIVSPVMNGLGSVSFWYRALNAESADSTFKVQTSVNGGTTWSDAGSGTFKSQTWAQYSCTINSTAGSIQFRVLNDNQAGHLILGDLVFTSYNVTWGSVSSSASAVSSATSSVSSAGFSSSSSSSSLGTTSSAGGGTTFAEDFTLPQTVRDYYRSAYGKSGSALKTALKTIITHTYTSYDGLKTLYATSDVRADGKIWDMYSTHADGTSHDGEWGVLGNATYFTTTKTYYSYTTSDAGASSSTEGTGGWNREHTWPKSNFGGSTSNQPGTDAHHITPTDVKVNGWRSNYPYGEVDSSAPYSVNGSRLGSARSGLGYSGTVFEPIDAYKGDHARMHFYMSVRYYNDSLFQDGDWSYAGAKLKPWYDAMMRNWNASDPVSAKEIARNNAIYNGNQKNRNPFIDYPALVTLIDFQN